MTIARAATADRAAGVPKADSMDEMQTSPPRCLLIKSLLKQLLIDWHDCCFVFGTRPLLAALETSP